MARPTVLHKTQTALTESLTPQEWVDFGTSIGQKLQPEPQPEPEHLRFSSPSWNLELMRTVAAELWKSSGKEGLPGSPKTISTPVPAGDLIGLIDGLEQSELPATPGIVLETRERKRKTVDYSIFSAGFDYDNDSDDDMNPSRRGRRRFRFKDVASSDAMDEDGVPTSSLPQSNTPYTGKKRGRPRKIVLDNPVKTSPTNDTPMVDAHNSSQLPASSPCRQQERRQVFREAVKEVSLLDSSVLRQLAKPVAESIPQPPQSILTTDDNNHQSVTENVRSHSLESAATTSHTTGNSSPSDATPLPAGLLRIDELPRHIAATLPADPEFFSRRDHVGPLIGGNYRTLVTPLPNPKPEAPLVTKGYLAIQPAWNPHAPRQAGQNGSIMQLSKTSLDPISKSQASFPVFVARGSNQWEYCGQFVVAEIAELSSFERYLHLTESQNLLKYWGEEIVRKRYEWAKELFVEAGGWSEDQWMGATATTVANMIGSGSVPMHWVHLQCVGFDRVFYDALLGVKRGSEIPRADAAGQSLQGDDAVSRTTPSVQLSDGGLGIDI
ncbi:hypothetical protein ABW21_db0208133 [Orbilia brochopaga]|nr:hypothetical protein ABW21_db0208133 [Drechslerella brochopaga]